MRWLRQKAPAVVILTLLVLVVSLLTGCQAGYDPDYYDPGPTVIVHQHTYVHVHTYVPRYRPRFRR